MLYNHKSKFSFHIKRIHGHTAICLMEINTRINRLKFQAMNLKVRYKCINYSNVFAVLESEFPGKFTKKDLIPFIRPSLIETFSTIHPLKEEESVQ